MVSLNYDTRELICKIVYYGPGLGGKTTNLQIIHKRVSTKNKGEMLSLATKSDRTLFFDFLPLDLGSIKGFTTKFQLYTVPGQVFYNETRKMVLRGADGVVFVADSQKNKLQENLESLENLKSNLKDQGVDITSIPLILQFNKMDLENVYSKTEMDAYLNKYHCQAFEAIAIQGKGVFEALKAIGKTVIDKYNEKYRKWGGSKYQKKQAPVQTEPKPQPLTTKPEPMPRPQSKAPKPKPEPAQPKPSNIAPETNSDDIDDNIQKYIALKKKRKQKRFKPAPKQGDIPKPPYNTPSKKPSTPQVEEPQLSDDDIFMTPGNTGPAPAPSPKRDSKESPGIPGKGDNSPFMDIQPYSGLDDDK